MLKTVLMSIKPRYAEAILSGDKKYEYRRSLWCMFDLNEVKWGVFDLYEVGTREI